MTLSKEEYRARARALKKYGFIDYDLRPSHEFTKWEKERIRKLYASNLEIIQRPENFFKKRASKKTRAAAKKAGIVTSKSALYIPKGEFTSVKIVHRKGVTTVKKISGEKASHEKLITGVALLRELERMGKKRLPPATYITVRIGKNAPFKSVFRRAADLLRYITTIFAPGDEDADIDELISGMSLVTYHGGIPEEYEKPTKRKKRRKGMTYEEKHARGYKS